MYDAKSILQMARGAFQERVDTEMTKVIANILDANTKPTQKRTDHDHRVCPGR